MFVNGLWYFHGARTATILYHVHHSEAGFLGLCLRFWWALRHPALPARSGLVARSRTAPRLPSTRSCVPLPVILSISCDGVLERLMGRLNGRLLRSS